MPTRTRKPKAAVIVATRRQGKAKRAATTVKSVPWSKGVDPRLIEYVTEHNIPQSRIKVVGPQEIIIHN